MVTMPEIEIIFQQLAASLPQRSERGYAILIVKDDTDKTFNLKEYSDITELDEADYTPENAQYIKDIFVFAPYKVCVVRIDATGAIADALKIVEGNIKSGWITIADGTSADFATLSSWNKSKESAKKFYKSVCYKVSSPDCKHIVNFYNDSVTFSDATRGLQTGEKYCPSLIGILAVCNINRAATNYVCSNLSKVTPVADENAAVGEGQFILINDVDEVKIGLGINSLITTNGTTLTEDMKYIDIVEAQDLMNDDIFTTFKIYQGTYKNKYDNQILFISAIGGYLDGLEEIDVLDDEYDNLIEINVAAQRAAWVAVGTADAANWSDAKVKKMAFKRSVFLDGDVKILGAMENLKLNMFMA